MPWFTLNRNYALSTTKGHSVNFKKGEKTWVPNGIVQEAIAIGAQPDEPIDILPPEVEKVHITDEKRRELFFAVFEKLLLRNQRGDFSANGQPHPKKLEEMLGFEVGQKEREAMWAQYNAKKSEEANQ